MLWISVADSQCQPARHPPALETRRAAAQEHYSICESVDAIIEVWSTQPPADLINSLSTVSYYFLWKNVFIKYSSYP